jgi:hypothetical protein
MSPGTGRLMRVPFGLSSYQRGPGDLPELPVINCYAEEAPTEEGRVVLQSRPGLSDRSANMGQGPVKQLFTQDGVLSGALFGVSNGTLYEATTSLGVIAGSGFVSMAGNEIGLMVTAGSSLYYWNGTVLATVSFPDSASVSHVFTGGSRFWAIRADTGKLYWTDSLEADVEALDFATAESLPDKLLQGLWIDGQPILFGAESVEFWQQTGSSTLPITPLKHLVWEVGIKATGCAVNIMDTFACVTSENNVVLQSEKNIISNAGLQARIEASTNVSLFTFLLDGVEFLALRLDAETQVFNPRTGMWSEFESYGETNWVPQCFASGVFGSSLDGKTLEWGTAHADIVTAGNPSGVLERRFRGGFAINGGGINIANVQLRCNVGQTPYLTGDYTEPTVEMRLSRDAGQTWGNWRGVSLGSQGSYRTKVQWRACGMASQPAFLAEFRVTDPIDVRFSDVLVNEAWGGR